MPLLSLALASALVTVLPAARPDSTPAVRPATPAVADSLATRPRTDSATAPVTTTIATPPATQTLAMLTAPAAAAASAPAAAPAPAPAPTVASWNVPVPMPAWATSTHTGLVRAARADSIVVEKGEHRMTLFAGGSAVGTYLVALGKIPVGAKNERGDFRTPEGLYTIDARNANSRYHRALHVSYPNADDKARAASRGIDPGGDVMIHGLPNGQGAVGAAHRTYDWTNGCVAVTDQEIEQIWSAVPVGTPIRIKP